jgi:hypothetical protein
MEVSMRIRSIVTALALLASSAPALPQEAGTQKGTWGLDVKPFEGLGLGFQLTDRFSLRPLFGGVRPRETGNQFTFGVDLRYELTRRTTLAPYLLGTLTYGRNYQVETDAGTEVVPRTGTFGAGLGLRQAIHDRWDLFGEVTLRHSTTDHANGVWNQIQFSDRDALRLGFGVTFDLKK